jgi:hypothetical protein
MKKIDGIIEMVRINVIIILLVNVLKKIRTCAFKKKPINGGIPE